MMRNKKGFFPLAGIITIMILGIILVGLLVWFGLRINEGLVAFFSFLRKWWWAIGLSISALLFHGELRAIIKFILGKFGIKV